MRPAATSPRAGRLSLGLLAAVLTIVAGSAVPCRAGSWPSILGPGRDGRSSETGILRQWPEGGPPLVWSRRVGEGYSMPAVAGGRLYHFDRDGDETRLVALEADSGRQLWEARAPTAYRDYYGYSNGPRASPLIDEGRVFAYGVDGRLHAHDAGSGRRLWQVDMNRRYGVVQNFFGVGSTPIVEGDLLLVMVGGSPPGSPDIHAGATVADGSAIVALDKRTGAERWRAGDELASYASLVVADIDGERYGLAFARGGLLGFDPRHGEIWFHYPWRARRLQSVNAATPLVSEGRVFLTESYGPGASLLEIADRSWRVVWRDPPGRVRSLASHWSTPVLHRGHLYGSSGEKSGAAELRCVEWETGRVMWAEPGLGRTTQLYVDEHVIVFTEYGELLLVAATPDRFEVAARGTPTDAGGARLLRYPAWSPPALADGILYLLGAGRLVALELVPGAG